MEITPNIITILFFVSLLAAWVDVIAGGGGLLTIPAMLLVGIPPATAIATNKLSASVGTAVAAAYFLRQRAVNLAHMKWQIFAAFIGSIFGSWLILKIDADALLMFLPILLCATGLYFWLSPSLDDAARKQKISRVVFALTLAPLLGFYDGFFGPGTGSFMALAFVVCCGYGLTAATANAKVLNCTSNISALAYFIFYGEIAWLVGVIMVGGQICGALLGAKMVLKQGAALIKPLVVAMCFLLSGSILLKTLSGN